VLNLDTISGVYDASVFLCVFAFSCNSIISLFLFPNTKNSARKNTPNMSHGLTHTFIANAPAAALMTKFTAIVSMSAKASCLSHAVYSCDSVKYPSAAIRNLFGSSSAVPNPIAASSNTNSKALIRPIFPDAIGLFDFSGCSLSLFLST